MTRKLAALGYAHVEDVQGALRTEAEEVVRHFLGDEITAIEDAPATEGNEDVPAFAFGARLDDLQAPTMAFSAPSFEPLPSRVDLFAEMPPIRNQGSRGCCVAFSTLAVYEHYLNRNGDGLNMSEQFQYFECKQNDGHPNEEGTWLRVSYPLLQSVGGIEEAMWKYQPNRVLGNEAQGPPPVGAVEHAAANRIPGFRQLPPTSVDAIKAELAAGHPVSFSIPVFSSWARNPNVVQTGDIGLPFPYEQAVGGHAMCIFGYDDSPRHDMGPLLGSPVVGYFFVRNSWGPHWGTANGPRVGYGTIPYAYIDRYGMEAFTIS